MQVILREVADAFNDNGRQLAVVGGVLEVLGDLAAGHNALNTAAPGANAILVQFEALTDRWPYSWNATKPSGAL